MAILNKIRQRSLFLIIIIALALFSFVLADVLKNGGFSGDKQNTIGQINDTKIDRDDFSRKVEQQLSRLGGSGTTTRAVNTVWDQEVNRVVLEEQYEELGIKVSEERLTELLKGALESDPRFQDSDGFFSTGKMNEFIATLKESTDQTGYLQWVAYENQLKTQEQQTIYNNLIKAGVGATLKDGEVAYKLDGNTVDVQFVQIPYTAIADEEVEVSKADISAYINEHKDEFESEATRSIRYVKFDEKPSLEDENALMDEMKELISQRVLYNGATRVNDTLPGFKEVPADQVGAFIAENSELPYADRFAFKNQLPSTTRDSIFDLDAGAIYGPYKDGRFVKIDKVVAVKQLPDSVKSRHILLAYQGAMRSQATRSKDEAKSLADSLLAVVKRSTSKFGDLAGTFSDDQGSKENGGEYDFSPYGQFVPEFNDFLFEGKEGDLDIVETTFGYHIIEVLDQKAKQRAIKVATLAKEVVPSDKTIAEVYNTTQKFEIAATQGAAEQFEDIAKESNYTSRPVNGMRALEENLPGLGSQRSIVQWAFEEETSVGDVKRFQVNDGYVVAQVTKRTKKGLKSAEDASVQVTPIIRNQKKAAILKGRISGTDLNSIASNQSQTVKTAAAINMANPTIAGAGREPKVVGAIFSLKEGEISEPIEGDRGVYIVKATKVNEATALDNYSAFAAQETQKARAGVSGKVLNALKEAAEIEDNRATFY